MVVRDSKYSEKQSELENLKLQISSLLQGYIDLLSQKTDDLSENDSECECADAGEEHDENSQQNSVGKYLTSQLKLNFFTQFNS